MALQNTTISGSPTLAPYYNPTGSITEVPYRTYTPSGWTNSTSPASQTPYMNAAPSSITASQQNYSASASSGVQDDAHDFDFIFNNQRCHGIAQHTSENAFEHHEHYTQAFDHKRELPHNFSSADRQW